jgi:hypothetical protein
MVQPEQEIYLTIPLREFEYLHAEVKRLRDGWSDAEAQIAVLRNKAAGLNVEHEIQRQLLERLGIAWTPGEPFYSLVEAELRRLQEIIDRA